MKKRSWMCLFRPMIIQPHLLLAPTRPRGGLDVTPRRSSRPYPTAIPYHSRPLCPIHTARQTRGSCHRPRWIESRLASCAPPPPSRVPWAKASSTLACCALPARPACLFYFFGYVSLSVRAAASLFIHQQPPDSFLGWWVMSFAASVKDDMTEAWSGPKGKGEGRLGEERTPREPLS